MSPKCNPSNTPLLYKGNQILISSDDTNSVAKKWASFSRVQCQLWSCPRVKFKLLFPALLKIILSSGVMHTFKIPETAMDCMKANIKTGVTPTPSVLD